MTNAGFLGISLLAYASWQAIQFLDEKTTRIWAKPGFHRYSPRPTQESLKKNRSCSNCSSYRGHEDFLHSGICLHTDWKNSLKTSEVMVKREGSCELWHKISPRREGDRALLPDPSLFSESASELGASYHLI